MKLDSNYCEFMLEGCYRGFDICRRQCPLNLYEFAADDEHLYLGEN
jgi:hypothetical protein